MADVIAKIPGQPVTASVDLLFKDLTLTLSGPAPKVVDTLTMIADLKHQVSDLQSSFSESLPPVSSETSSVVTGNRFSASACEHHRAIYRSHNAFNTGLNAYCRPRYE